MTTSLLSKPNIKLIPLTAQYHIIKLSHSKQLTKSLNLHRFITNPRLTLECSLERQNLKLERVLELAKRERKRSPYEIVANAVLKSLKPLRVLLVALVLFILVVSSALVASGGRTGRQSRSSGRSRSSSSSSRKHSSSSRSSGTESSSDDHEVSGITGYLQLVPNISLARNKLVVFSTHMDWIKFGMQSDTSTIMGGVYNILTETTRALTWYSDYCVSGYSSFDLQNDTKVGEKKFNQLSTEERGKFDKETLVNVDSVKKQSTSSKEFTGENEYMVITILVDALGVYKLPTIRSAEDLEDALKILGSIPMDKILAVEVLWTPQEENNILTGKKMVEDYPLLRFFK